MKRNATWILLVALSLSIGACDEEIPTIEQHTTMPVLLKAVPQDSTALADSDDSAGPEYLQWRAVALASAGVIDTLRRIYDKNAFENILALNRIDSRHIRLGDTLSIPDSLYDSFLEHSPFPRHSAALDSVAKILLFSYRIQAFAAYAYGDIVYWGPTSLGKKSTPTPTGLYFTNWKARRSVSSINSSWILPWNCNIDNFRGISLHQYELPGYPASHACGRLLNRDAKWIYHWTDSWKLKAGRIDRYGTPVIVFGSYDYSAPPPWKALPLDPEADRITQEELAVITDYLPEIIRKQPVPLMNNNKQKSRPADTLRAL